MLYPVELRVQAIITDGLVSILEDPLRCDHNLIDPDRGVNDRSDVWRIDSFPSATKL